MHRSTRNSAEPILKLVYLRNTMAIISVPANYFLIYPMYYGILNFPEEAVLGMYQVILPGIKSIFQALLVFNLPFTFVKGLICVAISMFIYKPLTKVLKEKS